jgi:hypothetical protein
VRQTKSKKLWELESKLGGSHDIAFPIPEVRTTTNKCRIFCIMLLSPEDVESGAASWKMNRASNLNGGADVAVFFLLKYSGSCAGNGRHKTKVANGGGDDEGNRRKDPMAAFLELQIACVYFLCFLLHRVPCYQKPATIKLGRS